MILDLDNDGTMEIAVSDINYLDIAEFRELGFLQEANRLFFHPLGLALEVVVNDDGTEKLGGIWDYRDDPEGIIFGPDVIDVEKIQNVTDEYDKHDTFRCAMFGSSDPVQSADE
jgi:hypothetical protein